MTRSSCDIEIRVRYSEVDQMGVLHHSRYWEYFEMGRTELLRCGGVTYRDVEAAGVLLVMTKCSARFLAPARYDDALVLTTTMTRMTTARIDHSYELRRPGPAGGTRKAGNSQPAISAADEPRKQSAAADPPYELLATAETTLACIDPDGKIIPIPDMIRGGKR